MNANWYTHYTRWNECESLDSELRQQLTAMHADEKQLADCFSAPIAFGTGGMRGVMEPGINRINLYTIRKASAGLALYLLETYPDLAVKKVVIAYDSRKHSQMFAKETAKVLGQYGITTCIFKQLTPTPLLSFAVRYYRACAGIVITASHNPPEYNGYKIYGADGGQITLATAERLMDHIANAGNELEITPADEQELHKNGLLHYIDDSLLHAYLEKVKQLRVHPDLSPAIREQVKIVFTPLHGTTHDSITRGLKQFGYTQVSVVLEQAIPDPNFSTVDSPNPEEPEAFRVAISCAKQVDADMIMGTDPDGDRLGVLVKNKAGDYSVLTGNQLGAMLLHYLLETKQKKGELPTNGLVLKTIVTSEMGRAIAADFGVLTEDTLTGFKYIGEKIEAYKKSGAYVFQFGYEESYGYLIGDFVRDKDAVQTALLLADMCAYCKSQHKSLADTLNDLFDRYGHYAEELISFTCKGGEGMQKISATMSSLRNQPPSQIASHPILAIEDYASGIRTDCQTGTTTPLTLPASDTIKYFFHDHAWFCVRPSGTEPKIKIYLGVKGTSSQDSQEKLFTLKQAVLQLLDF
ncbi:phosphoglucomutase [Brevibacillus brevis NBRC 100599]|uniref:Phosphoglucomutase n=1 Tax=Brevibacillus brevis (strain 47 / JCM 6285 / NBRC 100599) TaxID=358681 RepID=C0ZAC5_BREBN|nr:phospho-sugar mutase [Brevibacillus brevis]BAH42734.1 phosphoglucomutase [Brevibacillus brevis NBRC 100599]